MTAEQHLRRFAVDREWPASRQLGFKHPNRLVGFPLERLMRAIFTAISGGRRLPDTRIQLEGRTYNWGTDNAIITPEGDGILFAIRCFGVLPGDGVDESWHMVVGDQVRIIVPEATDYTPSELHFQLGATQEAIEAATDAILTCASAAELVLLRRTD